MKFKQSHAGISTETFTLRKSGISTSFLILITFLFSSSVSNAQLTQSVPGNQNVVRAAEFNGHYYTAPDEWILNKLHSPNTSLIGDPPCSTIEVTYNGFTPEAQAAFQYAVDIWETVISSPVNITINANWTVLDPGILGSAGPTSFQQTFTNAPNGNYYPVAIANQIAGYDLDPANADINCNFSSVFDWYLGTDGATPFNQYDFVTVVMHEIGHGLGFLSSKSYDEDSGIGSIGIGLGNTPLNYDTYLTLGSFGTDLTDLSGTALGDAIVGNNVYSSAPSAVLANAGVAPRIYAPAIYAGGSSISHWDEATYAAGNPNSLMTPQIGAGEAIHNPGNLTIGMFEDMGWTICYNTIDYNDSPCSAITLNVDESTSIFSNVDATVDAGEIGPPGTGCQTQDGWCSTNELENTIWFKFIAPASGNVNILTCNEGTTVDTQVALYSASDCDDYSTFTLIGANDDLSGCTQLFASSLTSCVIPGALYYLQVDGYDGSSGDIAISLSEVDGPDCEILTDGCINQIPYDGAVLDGTNNILPVAFCAYEEEYSEIENAMAGMQYTITSSSDGGGYLTVRSGTYNGPVLGSGFSPLTITAEIDGSLFLHYTVNEFCDTGFGLCVNSEIQCNTCFDCMDLSANIGDPCDDGNPETSNDVVTDDCECAGSTPCLVDFSYASISLTGTNEILAIDPCNIIGDYNTIFNAFEGDQYTFTAVVNDGEETAYITVRSGTYDGPVIGAGYSPLTITSDIDGTLFTHFTYNEDCSLNTIGCFSTTVQCITCDYDCPIIGADFGESCDDGNPNTNFDVITEDCTCAGSLPPANDNCIDAIPLECDDYVIGTNVGASLNLGCNLEERQTVWYSFTSEVNADVFMTTCNPETNFDTDINMYTGTCDGSLECFSGWGSSGYIDGPSSCSFQSWASEGTFLAEAGVTYYIAVTGFYETGNGFNPWEGTFGLSLSCETLYDCPDLLANIGDSCDDGNYFTTDDVITEECTCVGTLLPVPDNDTCLDATPLECDDYVIGTNVGASINEGCNIIQRQTVWYSFTALENTSVFMTTCNPETNFDTDISMFTGTCDGELVCYSGWGGSGYIDGNSACAYEAWVSEGSFIAEAGVLYYIAVSGYYETGYSFAPWAGDFGLSLSCETIYDCPILEANIGDSCDDGDVNSINDVVTNDCNCLGEIPPATASLLTLPCGGQVIQITGALSGATGGGTATSETRTIYAFGPDGIAGVVPSYSGSSWPYVVIGSTIDVSPEISATISYNESGYLSVNGRLAYQFVGDGSPGDANGPGGPWTYFLPNGDISQDACPVDCPILGGNIGDPCDDSNPDTNNDMITPDCICLGTYPTPANNFCSNAEEIDVNAPGDCPDNAIIGTTNGATDENGEFECDGGDYVWPDVFYSFNSGDYSTILLEIAGITQTDIVFEILTTCGGESLYCGIGSQTTQIALSSNTDYILRIAPNLDWGVQGTFSLCLSGIYDCPELSANIGDPCDDGNANTINDVVTVDCACVGETTGTATLNGSADWNNNCGDREINFSFYQAGTSNLVSSYTTSIDASGAFSLADVPMGTFDIYVKIDGQLANGYYNQSISVGSNTLALGSFIPGDLNNNNGINITDFSLLNISFGTSVGDPNYNFLADMNCDGNVNIIDVSILNIGFGQVGAQP